MSIQSETTRIGNALNTIEGKKAALADAVTAKGVPTPSDAGFDTIAANIAAIESGGGVGEILYENNFTLEIPSDITSATLLVTIPDSKKWTYAGKNIAIILSATRVGDDIARGKLLHCSQESPLYYDTAGISLNAVVYNEYYPTSGGARHWSGSNYGIYMSGLNTNVDCNIYARPYSNGSYSFALSGTYNVKVIRVKEV